MEAMITVMQQAPEYERLLKEVVLKLEDDAQSQMQELAAQAQKIQQADLSNHIEKEHKLNPGKQTVKHG